MEKITFTQRFKRIIAFLQEEGSIENQKNLGYILGFENESSFSAVVNEKNPLAEKHILKISELFPNINTDWLMAGKGEMLKSHRNKIKNEVTAVPEDDYMMVEFEDLETAAGKLGGGDVSVLPERKRRLVPKEYKKGNYLVVRVHGHSMDDGTKRSISEGEEVLIKECYENDFNLPIRNKLFVIVTNDGSVIKQIKEINKDEQYIVCHSFNPNWEDYTVNFSEILQVFTVEKKVKSNIIF